jgi:Predicted signal transduction protein
MAGRTRTLGPAMGIAVLVAVLVAVAAGWLVVRGRRGAEAVPRMDRPGAAGTAAGHAAAAEDDPAGPAEEQDLLPERAIFGRLCAAGFGDAALEGTLLDEATAGEALERIHAHPRYIPRRPALLPQLTRAINDPGASAQSIAAIVAQDPALAGNLLRVANSVVYRRGGVPVEQLDRAVTLLGTEGLRQAVMVALVQPVIGDDGTVYARCAARLWEHTALSARLAAGAGQGGDWHLAQLLALVYGLGALVVVQVLRDTWGRRGEHGVDADTLASLLAGWAARCALAISADWGLSGRVQQALEELAAGEADAPGELVRAVRHARTRALARMPAGPEPDRA